MKPKNRILCPDCGRPKILFESENKANNFIKFNASEISHGDRLRSYYCPACCGWHVSSHKYDGVNRTEILLNKYHRSCSNLKSRKPKASPEEQELMEQIANILCEKHKFYSKEQIRRFFKENIPRDKAIMVYYHKIKQICYNNLKVQHIHNF